MRGVNAYSLTALIVRTSRGRRFGATRPRPGRGDPGDRGIAMVELALVMPVFLVVLVGVMEFGMLVNAYVTVQHAAREGARLGITGATDAEIAARVRATAVPLSPGLVGVGVQPAPSLRERGEPITVTVTYTYDFMTPFVGSIVGDGVVLSSSIDMRME